MKRNVIETVLGGVVLLTAGVFLTFSYQTADVGSGSGYNVTADFSSIGGLSIGDPVQVSGVKVGTVTDITLLDDSYLARVTVDLDPKIKLPSDTVALISSQSLLGGRYLSLEPGAEEDMIKSGGRIQYTQAPQNLEQLLGQFIFSMKDAKDDKAAAQTSTAAATSIPEIVQPALQETPSTDETAIPAAEPASKPAENESE